MPRTFTIGDIHGAYKALLQLIDKISPQVGDRLIFLGDYVDGWSQSAELIAYLAELDEKHDCIFIKGNHDAWCEDWLAGGRADNDWLLHGGKATVDSYSRLNNKQKKTQLAFFNKMRTYYIDDSNRLFIHAGFSSMHGPVKERYETNFYWDRTLWEMALSVDNRVSPDSKLYPKRLLLFKEIFIGHTPTINYDSTIPMQACNIWNVDTGAAFNGPLSALDIDTKQFFQSDIVQELYPKEKGRNK